MSINIDFIYISLSGNTQSFVTRLKKYILEKGYLVNINLINIKDIVKNNENFYQVKNKFVSFIPTYLEGGNGIDTGHKEILTTPLREFIDFENNKDYCVGIVGSGNKNFNNQYCLTAKQYSKQFNVEVIDNFELRGTQSDIERICMKIVKIFNL